MAMKHDKKFWAKVDRRGDDECWPWLGCRNSRGYGHMIRTRNGKPYWPKAHRYSLMQTGVAIPDGVNVLHKCDHPWCVNPSHLELGDQRKNMRDAADRGLIPWARLNPEAVKVIRYSAKPGNHSLLGRLHGVSFQQISRVLKGTRWGRA